MTCSSSHRSDSRARALHSLVDDMQGIESGCLSSPTPEVPDSMEIDFPDLQVVDVLVITIPVHVHLNLA